jgi:hypothetical protein
MQRHVLAVRREADAARRGAMLRALGDGPLVHLLPANRRRTTRLPAARRAAFVAYIASLAEVLQADGPAVPSEDTSPARTAPHTAAEQRVLGAACGTCRGSCCQGGDTRAWLTAGTLRRVQRETGLPLATLLRAYAADLPARSYAGSCVYHTARGCALAPARRSHTCHRYLCGEVVALVSLVRAGTEPSVRLAACDEHAVVRVRRVDLGD